MRLRPKWLTISWLLNLLRNLLLISAGSVLIAIAVNGILAPLGFASGGFVGLTMVCNHLLPEIPMSIWYLLLNIPIYLMGLNLVGRRFFVYSIVGALALSLALEFVQVAVPLSDKTPAALLAGILTGLGGGLLLHSQGSSGGSDILSVILLRRYSIRLGSTYLAFNVVLLSLVAYVFSLEGAVYTLMYMFVASQIMNLVLTGLARRKAVWIISPEWEAISQDILDRLRRGATVVPATGAYSGKAEHMLYTVVSFRELPKLKALVRKHDADGFVVVTDTLEVMGRRIGNQPHW